MAETKIPRKADRYIERMTHRLMLDVRANQNEMRDLMREALERAYQLGRRVGTGTSVKYGYRR